MNIPANSVATKLLIAYHTPNGINGLNCYRYLAYDKNNPHDTGYVDICFNIGFTGVGETEMAKTKVYPNPASDNVSIEVSNLTDNSAVLVITDLSGRQVKTQAIGNGINSVELAGLSEGMYVYKILDDSGVRNTGRLVVK